MTDYQNTAVASTDERVKVIKPEIVGSEGVAAGTDKKVSGREGKTEFSFPHEGFSVKADSMAEALEALEVFKNSKNI